VPPELVIRALAPDDAARVQAFVRGLSPETRRERYFSAIRELSPGHLERLVRAVMPDLSLAAFAGERIVGIAECSREEFAIVVGDAWQGCGVGHGLMERVVAVSRKSGMAGLRGIVRKGNRAMLRLARSFGFSAARDADPELVRMELELLPA
jgi:acetyltransferase